MGGTCMAMARWARDPAFYRDRPLVHGSILDIGPGHDPLAKYRDMFPLAERWTCLDHNMQAEQYGADWIRGDAIEGADRLYPMQFDLVYASHCLEHMVDPARALRIWWSLVKPAGGHLVIIVPSWVTYERCVWPSNRNLDHKCAWVLQLNGHAEPFICGLLNLIAPLGGTLVRALTLDANFDPDDPSDQTWTHKAECGLEVVVQNLETGG